MVGHPDDRSTFKTGCPPLCECGLEPNDRFGVR
jgi:hypothetical protein